MTPLELAAAAKQAAARLGFTACGICDLRPSETRAAFDAWLGAGMHGDMQWMARQAEKRRYPGAIRPSAVSAVVVLDTYTSTQPVVRSQYRVARYAQNADYHNVTRQRLAGVGAEILAAADGGSAWCYVDSGPVPERELARRAGLGWFGRNTMLIHPQLGSFTFIGVLLTDLLLARDEPFEADRCGTCTRCLDACPTDAFPASHVLDARRCISYLTIEHRGEIPDEFHPGLGDNLFGCDICQDVCPWNEKFAQETTVEEFRAQPESAWPTLDEILAMDDAAFEARFGPTPLERARRAGLQRNARVVRRTGVSG